jgi:hypothetical protein
VTGKVTYQGKPLKGGSVSFVSTEGRQSFASGIDEDGTYLVPNLRGGSYKVCVETSSLKPAKEHSIYTKMAPIVPKGAKTGPPADAQVPEGYTPSDPAAMAAMTAKKRYIPIPEHYADPELTDITYTFNGGAETFNIDLK